MIKRKRQDARSYRDYLMSLNKKHKGATGSERSQGNMMSRDHGAKLEADCFKEEDNKSDSFQLRQKRMDSEAKAQPDKGERSVEQQGCDQISSSVDASLMERGETVEDGAIKAVDIPSDNTDKIISAVEFEFDTKSEKRGGESTCEVQRFEGSRSSPRFIEYWVPVGFSHLQLEKYCESLSKHSMLLCASLKKALTDNLHDVLSIIRECCDHPYLVDSTLENFVNDRRPVVDYLNTGTEASGKFLLLDKFLQEVKEKGQRVVIVFQSKHSKSQLRFLLDGFIREKFGPESCVQIYRDVDRAQNRAELDLFNDENSGRFVMLMEKCTCQSSIKLSSVDFVILFNSDWGPMNDMKCVRKMSIEPTHDHVKVLRLYSPHSVEEMVLTLAKEGTVLESSMVPFSYSVSQMLLLWDATYLFSKLDDFHSRCKSIADLQCLSEDKLVLTALQELLLLLSDQKSDCSSFSVISKLPEGNDYTSATITLYGERDAPARDDDIPPHAIWISLLDGRNPMWRLLPGSSRNVRKRGELSPGLSPYAECGSEIEVTKRKSTPHLLDEFLQKSRPAKSPRLTPGRRFGKSVGHPNSGGCTSEQPSCRDEKSGLSHVEKTCVRRMRELVLKQKKEIREFYRSKREEKAKLDEEHQLQLDVLNQGCTEIRARQEEIKKLDRIYDEKLGKHKSLMDMKRSELEDMQKAARMKEKQLKDKLISLSKMTNFGEDILSLVNDSLLDSVVEPQTASLTDNTVDPPVTISDPALFSESRHSEDIEQGTTDESVQQHGPELPSVQLPPETKIPAAESDGENDAVSMLKEAESNGTDHGDYLRVRSVTAFVSEANVKKQSQDVQPAPNSEVEVNISINLERNREMLLGNRVEEQNTIANDDSLLVLPKVGHPSASDVEKQPQDVQLNRDTEGDSSTNTEHSKGALQKIPVKKQPYKDAGGHSNTVSVCPVNGSVESDGENDVAVSSPAEALDERVEPCGLGRTLHTSNETQVSKVSGQNNLHPMSKSPNRTVQQECSNMEGFDRALNGAIDSRDAADFVNRSNVPDQVNGLDPTDVPSSELTDRSPFIVQHQAAITTDTLLPLEQPITYVCPPSVEIRQAVRASAVSARQTSGNRSGHPNQCPVPLRNLGSLDSRVLQSPLQSFVGQNLPHVPTTISTTIQQAANNHFESFSSSRSNTETFFFLDPLRNELKRMKEEEEQAMKFHLDKTIHLNSACEKEIEEIRKKYDLLRQEADTELLQKRVALESICTKISANMALAETMKYHCKKPQVPIVSQDALLSAVLELPLLQQPNLSAQRSVAASVAPSAQRTPAASMAPPAQRTLAASMAPPAQRTLAASMAPAAPPVRVVHQLSDLMPGVPVRPQNPSTLQTAGNPQVCHPVQGPAPHLLPSRRPTHVSNIPTSLTVCQINNFNNSHIDQL